MRLWHYALLPYLPNSQIVAQWRELNSIFKKQDKHILINYVYDYPKKDLQVYSDKVIEEMGRRGIQIRSLTKYLLYFDFPNYQEMYTHFACGIDTEHIPFRNHHTERYLVQCFYNLQEKYDRGQKDFSKNQYTSLERYVERQCHNEKIFDNIRR